MFPLFARRYLLGRWVGFAVICCFPFSTLMGQESEAEASWQELRSQLTKTMIDRAVEPSGALAKIAGSYLQNQTPEDQRWDDAVRAKLKSADPQLILEGVNQLSSTSIGEDEQIELLFVALRNLDEPLKKPIKDRSADWWQTHLEQRIIYPDGDFQASRQAAVVIRRVASRFADNFKAKLIEQLDQPNPLPIYFVIVYQFEVPDLSLARKLGELAKSDDEDTAGLAALTLMKHLELKDNYERRLVQEHQEKYLGYAERIILRSDKNGDRILTRDEWKDMLMDVSPADENHDGRVTVEEYAKWLRERAERPAR